MQVCDACVSSLLGPHWLEQDHLQTLWNLFYLSCLEWDAILQTASSWVHITTP